MTLWAMAASALGAGALAVTGYLAGARRGVVARDALRGDLARAEGLAHEATQAAAEVERARAESAQRADALGRVERDAARASREAAQKSEALERACIEVAQLTARLEHAGAEAAQRNAMLERAHAEVTLGRKEIHELRGALALSTESLARSRREPAPAPGAPLDEVRRMLAPLLDRARLQQSIAEVGGAVTTRGELPRLLDEIARRGGFEAVVLSDDAGLPVAASEGTAAPEDIAGVASMVLTMGDRATAAGAPEPRAVLVHDVENRTLLHRVLRARGERFLLTAVGQGTALGVDALDPALPRLERMLEA